MKEAAEAMGDSEVSQRADEHSAVDPEVLHRSRHKIALVDRAGIWKGVALEKRLIVDAVRVALNAHAKIVSTEVAIVLTDDEEIRVLNAKWRGQNKATNVLAFPLGADEHGMAQVHLGDVVLAFETITREAEDNSISLSARCAHLSVHGILHILGYDHCDDVQAREMEAMEAKILRQVGIKDPYEEAALMPEIKVQ